jgi:hypothetical protein
MKDFPSAVLRGEAKILCSYRDFGSVKTCNITRTSVRVLQLARQSNFKHMP